MARLARAVFPGHPHHVTQRGNGRAIGRSDEVLKGRGRQAIAALASTFPLAPGAPLRPTLPFWTPREHILAACSTHMAAHMGA